MSRRRHSPESHWSPLAGSLGPLAEQHHLDGVEDDRQVEEYRQVLDVIQFVSQFFHRIFESRPVAILDLGPTGQAGLYRMALLVEGDVFCERRDEGRPL